MPGLDALRERIWLLYFVAASWLITWLLSIPSIVDVNYTSFAPVILACLFFYGVALVCHMRKIRYIGIACELFASGLILTLPVLISTYLAFSLKMPLSDAELIAMDEALMFDWHALINFVNTSYWVEWALGNAYSSFSFQLMGVPILLVALGHTKRAVAFVAGYGILCFISSFIAIWYPALGTYVMYGVSQADVPNIRAKFGFVFLEQFNALREASAFELELSKAAGILTFPSVHAAVAFFIIWAMWVNVWTRYPFMVLNLAMALSAVSHANHYLVDIIAGGGIAAVTAAIVAYIFMGRRLEGFARRETLAGAA